MKYLLPLCLAVGFSIFAESPQPTISRPATTRVAATRPAVGLPATVKVVRGSLHLKFDAPAYLEPVDPLEVRLRFKQYNGELTILAIAPTAMEVKKGQKLLEIDPAPLRKQLNAAENELIGAQASLEKLQSDYKLAEEFDALATKPQRDGLHDAEDALKWWDKVDGPQMLREWDLQIEQYQHVVEDRGDELEQLRKMYKSEELTSATADIVVKRALRAYDQAKIGLEMEKARTEKSKQTYYLNSRRTVEDNLTRARQSLALAEVTQANTKTQWKTALFSSQAALAAIAQKVEELRGDLEKLTIFAPDDGIAWYGQLSSGFWQNGDGKYLRPGEKVQAGQVILTFQTPVGLRAVAELPEARAFSIPEKTKVTLVPTAFPGMRLTGTAEPAPASPIITQDRGVVYPLRITLDDQKLPLRPGQRGNARFNIPTEENVLLIPTSAVSNGDVWLIEADGSAQCHAVVTGRVDGKQIEVVSGLAEGNQILEQAKGGN